MSTETHFTVSIHSWAATMANHTGPTYREQWQEAAVVLRKHAAELDELAKTAPPRPVDVGDADRITKMRELVDYLRTAAGTVPTPLIVGNAFIQVADYVDAIVRGEFESLPWGVGTTQTGRPA